MEKSAFGAALLPAARVPLLPLFLLLACVAGPVAAEETEGEDVMNCLLFGMNCEFNLVNPIVAVFFLAWNFMISPSIVAPIVRCIVFGCADGCRHLNGIFCIFPHWYVGILLPCYFGGAVSASMAVGIPYMINFGSAFYMALKERRSVVASEATLVKMDVLGTLKEAMSEVRYANHRDDVIAALDSMLEALADVHLADGRSVLQSMAAVDAGTQDSEKATSEILNAEATVSTDELRRSSTTQSSIVKVAKTISGSEHFSTGISNLRL
eukprot:TRINITY_DN35727_c0_g1_i1.p1 TRINITY_DN35727_c0_g1~~TRINITY_DN35727_c0_g1_i1.p1  ORF type:complete len:283 (+),score=48.65 TRINITY_DN35727_c0_g1_i1:51-851(+)